MLSFSEISNRLKLIAVDQYIKFSPERFGISTYDRQSKSVSRLRFLLLSFIANPFDNIFFL